MQNMQNSQTIFHFAPWRMELSKFTANCAKSAQLANPCPELREICALHAHFSRFFADFAQFTLLEITQATANSAKFALYLLICNNFIILTLVRQDPAPCLSKSCEIHNLKLQFAKYQLCMKFQLLCTH